MAITFKAVVFQHHKKQDGTYNVKIRVTHNRIRRFLPTNIFVTKEDLTRGFKIKSQNVLDNTKAIIDNYLGITSTINTQQANKMSVDDVLRYIEHYKDKNEVFRLDFFEYATKIANELKETGHEGNGNTYQSAINSFKCFLGRNNVDILEITVQCLTDYCNWLKTKPAQKNRPDKETGRRAPSLYLSTIRAIHNRAKNDYNDEDAGIIRIPLSPFKKINIPPVPVSRKRALKKEILVDLINLPYEIVMYRGNNLRNFTKDIFLLSFGLIGMNAIDLYNELNKRTEFYAAQVRKIYDKNISEIIQLCDGLEVTEDKPFKFSDYEDIAPKTQKLLRKMYSEVYQSVRGNIVREWNYSNLANDKLVQGIFGKQSIEDNHFARYFGRNKEAMNSFFARKEQGLDLSQRVWRYIGQAKEEMELALDLGLGEGLSAGELSRTVRQFLHEPDKLFRRVRNKHGNLVLSNAAKAYHPGRGVYRSSYKNAQRLTRTETNMAYRSADTARWEQLDFVIGYEVKLSKNHTLNGVPFTDICDDLAGKYPKTFKFKSWHLNCRCYIVPILCTEAELEQLIGMILSGEDTAGFSPKGIIEDVPDGFKDWTKKNMGKIEKANIRGTLPYFLKDNANFATIFVNKMNVANKVELLKEAKAKYNSYNADDWIKAGFDEFSGGYRVYHKNHNFDPTIGIFDIPRGDYEKKASDILVKYGMSVVLESEIAEDWIKTPDGLLNGVKFDIKGIEGSSHRIIKEAISKSSKQGAEITVFYFHDKNMFDMGFVREGYEKYLTNSKSKRVKKVYCIVGKYLYRV